MKLAYSAVSELDYADQRLNSQFAFDGLLSTWLSWRLKQPEDEKGELWL